MKNASRRPRRQRSWFFWAMLALWLLLAVGAALLVLGIVHGAPPYYPLTVDV